MRYRSSPELSFRWKYSCQVTKEEYIKERLHLLHREADETYDEVKKEIQKLQSKADAMKLLARETLRYGVM